MDKLKEIKELDSGLSYDRYKYLEDEHIEWLIQQAETLRKIADTWVAIETNGTSEDADNFYTIVQDILSPPQDN